MSNVSIFSIFDVGVGVSVGVGVGVGVGVDLFLDVANAMTCIIAMRMVMSMMCSMCMHPHDVHSTAFFFPKHLPIPAGFG